VHAEVPLGSVWHQGCPFVVRESPQRGNMQCEIGFRLAGGLQPGDGYRIKPSEPGAEAVVG